MNWQQPVSLDRVDTRHSVLRILDLFHDSLGQARFDFRFWCPTSKPDWILLKDLL